MKKTNVAVILKLRRAERDERQRVLAEAAGLCANLAGVRKSLEAELRKIESPPAPDSADPSYLADRDSRRAYLTRELRLCGRKEAIALDQERTARANFTEAQKQLRLIEELITRQQVDSKWEARRREELN